MTTNVPECLIPETMTLRSGRALQLAGIKARMQTTWAAGDFALIGTTLQIVGESLCEAVDLRAGERVLDVACGNGNAALAAARRWASVVGVDFVPELLRRASERVLAERADVELHVGDAEALPFDDGAFDVVLSTYGVMFAPDHERAAAELARVCAPGGRIGLANWTPGGFIGLLLRTVAKHVPPAPGVRCPTLWGDEDHLRSLVGGVARRIDVTRKEFAFRYRSAAHFIDLFRRYYGPTHKAFAALDAPGQTALAGDMTDLLLRFDRGGGTSLVVPAEYLEVVIDRQ
jgi:SAM-dependent methyltransferase